MNAEKNINIIMGVVALGALGMCAAHCHESSSLRAEIETIQQDRESWYAEVDKDMPAIEAYLGNKIYSCVIEPSAIEGEYVCISLDNKRYYITKKRMAKALAAKKVIR